MSEIRVSDERTSAGYRLIVLTPQDRSLTVAVQ
jgi:hypothetical protein